MNRLQFGNHVIDTQTRTLTRCGQRVPLQRQPFELLQVLAERAGQVVTREDIRARLWAGTIVEYDLSINYGIRQIRAALGPDAAFIQTVPRQGYRFTAAVTPAVARHRTAYLQAGAAAALLALAFASGFGTGVLARNQAVGQFVYDHLVHPDRCPYIRMFLPAHRNS